MDDKLPIISSSDKSPRRDSFCGTGGCTDRSSFRYEELTEDSVPCPSCKGTGRIPKDQEKQLVALIPFTDSRLKPRRTTLWVILAVAISIIVSAVCMFFLIPRSIEISSNDYPLMPYYAEVNETESFVKLGFVNYVNITNNNYVTISVINATMVSIHVLDSRRVVGQTKNLTWVTVPLRSQRTLEFNTILVFESDLVVKYCNLFHVIFMQFDITVTSSYLGHNEQTSLSANRRLLCTTRPEFEFIP